MKALVWTGADQLELRDLPKPPVGLRDVLVKVKLVGICGSDPTIYHGKHLRAKPPLIMGHEMLGEIVETGDGVAGRFSPGERVVLEPTYSCGQCEWCKSGRYNLCGKLGVMGADGPGAFAEYMVASVDKVHRLLADIPDQRGVLAEPLAVTVHAARMAGLKRGDNVAVLGGGPIGLLAGVVALVEGARKVMVVEVKPFRLHVAQEFGLTPIDGSSGDVVERVLSETGGEGADVVIDAAGALGVAPLLTSLARRGGIITVVGIHKQPPAVDLRTVMYRELRMSGSFIYVSQDFRKAVDLLSHDKLRIESKMVTHEFPLECAAEAIRTAESAADALKVVLRVA